MKMLNFNDTFFFEMSLMDMGASEQNGIVLDNEFTSFPDAEKAPESDEIELFEAYVELYNQVKDGGMVWKLRIADETTRNTILNDAILKDELEKNDISLNEIDQWISGKITIPSFSEAFSKEGNSKLGYYITLKHLEEDPHSYIPIDICNSLTACLKIENGRLINNVFIVDDEALEVYNMNVSLTKYFELAYACKVFMNWQTVYIFKSKAIHHRVMIHILPLLFPVASLDLSEFE